MLKNIILTSIFFACHLGFSQYEWTPAQVILKNGTSFRGLVKFPIHSGGLVSIGTTDFKYKKKRKSGTEKYGQETVYKVVFGDEQFAIVEYQYVPINKNKSVLMELLVSGKVNLYTRTVSRYNTYFMGNGNFPTSSTIDYNSEYYLKRDNEIKATLISGPKIFSTFNQRAKQYFSDCQEISDYIESDLYDLNNLFQLVDDYNLLCQ